MRDFIDNLITSKNSLLGIPKGLTVFKGLNGLYYYKKDQYEAETRIFKNITQNYFEKDILRERLQSNTDAKFILSSNPIYIEYKDLNQNEFSYWSIDSLGMSPRKREELSNFKNLLAEFDGFHGKDFQNCKPLEECGEAALKTFTEINDFIKTKSGDIFINNAVSDESINFI